MQPPDEPRNAERLAFGELLRSVERERYRRLLDGTGAAGGSGPQEGGTTGSGGGSGGSAPRNGGTAAAPGRGTVAPRDRGVWESGGPLGPDELSLASAAALALLSPAVGGGRELLQPGRRQWRATRRVEGARGGEEVPAAVCLAIPRGVLDEPVRDAVRLIFTSLFVTQAALRL